MARTKSEFSERPWRSFRISQENHSWLAMFKAEYGLDFQDCLELALRIGLIDFDWGEVDGDSLVGDDVYWRSTRIYGPLHDAVKAAGNGAKLQEVGAALLEKARPVMRDQEQLLTVLGELEMPADKFQAQMEILRENLVR